MEKLQDLRIFTLPAHGINQFSIHFPKTDLRETAITVRLAKQGSKWLFESPINAEADAEEIDILLKKLVSLRAIGFAAAVLRAFAAATPRLAPERSAQCRRMGNWNWSRR